jgi:hypothetical protein
MAKAVAEAFVKERARLGFPLLPPDQGKRAAAAFEANLEAGASAAALAAAREIK